MLLTNGRSAIIDDLQADARACLQDDSNTSLQPAPIAYFYCTRNTAEPERADPEEILRCLLQQLSSQDADVPIRHPVVKAYNEKEKEGRGRMPENLSLEETVELILELLKENPAIIIIDALDECNPLERRHLLSALDKIIYESSSLVQILVSSRDDRDLENKLSRSPNVYIKASDNQVDIERFVLLKVNQAIEEGDLIGGKVSDTIKDRIVKTLIDGAQGM